MRIARALFVAGLGLVACGRPDVARDPVVGQWVWSREDAALLARGRAERPGLRSAVWIGTLHRDGARVVTQLGVPAPAAQDSATTLVIRLDDSLHPLVAGVDAARLRDALGARIAALLDAAGATGGAATVQLDYDAPVRLLPRWAAVLRELRVTTLRGHPVWITSLLVHVEQPAYGGWFRDAVDGHVLQLFDTRVAYSATTERKVERVLADARLRAAIGIGAFERRLAGGGRTEHREWLPWAMRAARAGRVEALWIFAASQPYAYMLSTVGP